MSTEPVKIIVPNKNGEKLVGLLHDTGSKEVVIICHGFTGTKDVELMVNLAVALEKEGISCFRFDFSGNGESDGTISFANYMGEVEDIRAVVNHFNGGEHVVSAVIGHSKGAAITLLYASKYHDLHTVATLSGFCDVRKIIVEMWGEKIKKDGHIDFKCEKTGKVLCQVTEEALTDFLNLNMPEALLKIDKDCRVLIVHGSADESIPFENAHMISSIIPNHTLRIIEGANHIYTEHQAELASAVVDFIKACMQRDIETSI